MTGVVGTYWCERAWLPDGVAAGVRIDVDASGRITCVSTEESPPETARWLRGLVLPGMANAHSHAFHRALRGHAAEQRGTFWTWRDRMYQVAARLDPELYYRLATAVFAEMVLAGITCVGEFHYVHHPLSGGRYDDPNAMSAALVQAARDAGIRLTLLDTCYLSSGFGEPVDGVQVRYSDDRVERWVDRVERFDGIGNGSVRLGAAVHSVRAVPPEAISVVADWARRKRRPLHVHLSEQRAENEACLAAHGCTPTELLASVGALGAGTTAVHATHLTDGDLAALGDSGTGVCLCPTTEADLADGIGPAASLAASGSPLSVGSDGQSVIDMFAELRFVESGMRLTTQTRGHFSARELMSSATITGHSALGWSDAGWIGAGARADLVAVDLGGVRLAGVPPEVAVLSATADDVRDVVVDGEHVVQDGRHLKVPNVADRLREGIAALL